MLALISCLVRLPDVGVLQYFNSMKQGQKQMFLHEQKWILYSIAIGDEGAGENRQGALTLNLKKFERI